MSTPKLFQPIKVGNAKLQHRVVLAPLTRYRATRKEHVPIVPLVGTYYSQRSRRPGSLVITEATFIKPEAGGYDNAPGIWNHDQIKAWKQVTDEVHANGSYIFVQLWALGRAAKREILAEDEYDVVSASSVPLEERNGVPRPLTVAEIKQYVQWYAQAARNAVEAGFDGVEVHSANGYLPDQFLQDVTNHRTDEYGGSIENRSRFPLEIIDAVVKAIGQERTALRISPFNKFQNMGMANPVPQFTHFVKSLVAAYPNWLTFILSTLDNGVETESSDFLRDIWAPRPLIVCGGFDAERLLQGRRQQAT
ncbi:hypothetical protein CPB84DRAFT_1391642 [Gymnopilus junonius]|uniref:NADH:flavin oxidoreductase/NADH oxidase N-terminal domain-containing protein n=1 Tax=Gymnopilus junonius TaxID=109634 RepID=A0A9P5NKH8_GYMJU|nr:hypothetical protein CPB84DRAFT_1391642 [Gymnopilus junonius]